MNINCDFWVCLIWYCSFPVVCDVYSQYKICYFAQSVEPLSISQVILGRATNDVHVDIDLGKEGEEAATKISRRQALIKLDADGSFILKNLGKRSIFLNGKEIATGQARGLGASSVIEIRGISLIFETNNRCVKSFLENVNEKI